MGFLKGLVMAVPLAMLAGCAHVGETPLDDGYQLGDGIAHYCIATDEAVRAAGRLLARRAGLTLPDLCAAHALVSGEVLAYEDEL
ncbi:hypothetical protein [Vreelandella alkaliphila]|uniref:Lipoprotein n=1 Tax=Vreelandella alkaliphila TaxID=272774 RepID=A0AAJ2VSN5_9GAMM|nr:hypothetical protein [Halomonas alkaliphila]MDX5979605.1 hypothetical protein [Halomonas alkaliphila]